MRPGVPRVRLLFGFDGTGDSCEVLQAVVNHALVGDESGFAALLVYVVRGDGLIVVFVTPSGDALIESEGRTFVGALRNIGLSVQDFYASL